MFVQCLFNHPACPLLAQAVAEALGRPLLCTSVPVDISADEDMDSDAEDGEGVPAPIRPLRAPDVGSLLHMYGPRGLDFIVDAARPASTYFPSTVRMMLPMLCVCLHYACCARACRRCVCACARGGFACCADGAA